VYCEATELCDAGTSRLTGEQGRRKRREVLLTTRAGLYLCGWSSTETTSSETGVPEAVAGIRSVRLYDLRHTAATLGIAAGVSVKAISDQFGHASISFSTTSGGCALRGTS
jgi:integrase